MTNPTNIEQALKLLSTAVCPDCDGSGAIPVVVETTDVGCCGRPLDTGECCGSPIPVPGQDLDIEPCQWCRDRAVVLGVDTPMDPSDQEELWNSAFDKELPF